MDMDDLGSYVNFDVIRIKGGKKNELTLLATVLIISFT
jgi:hypothetical protein